MRTANNMMLSASVTSWANVARKDTTTAATIKAWRLTNKAARQGREAAAVLASGKGYFIGSAADLASAFPCFAGFLARHTDTAKYIWGIRCTVERSGRATIVPVAYR